MLQDHVHFIFLATESLMSVAIKLINFIAMILLYGFLLVYIISNVCWGKWTRSLQYYLFQGLFLLPDVHHHPDPDHSQLGDHVVRGGQLPPGLPPLLHRDEFQHADRGLVSVLPPGPFLLETP